MNALDHTEAGEGVPILLIHPSGATGGTWGSAVDELAQVGRVITYDRRGYGRTGGEPVRSMATHTADAAALLGSLDAGRAVVVGTSSGAGIAIDLAVRRPGLVAAVVAHEFPWRGIRHVPSASQLVALSKIGWLALAGRQEQSAETLLRFAYGYRDGGSAWDAFPAEWRRIAMAHAGPCLADFVASIGNYPTRPDLASIQVPVVCSYGSRSRRTMIRDVRRLADAIPTAETARIEGAGHAAPFDATVNFVHLIAEVVASAASA
jgi:pimeloyl-ACP methyl ester carboxylesterase